MFYFCIYTNYIINFYTNYIHSFIQYIINIQRNVPINDWRQNFKYGTSGWSSLSELLKHCRRKRKNVDFIKKESHILTGEREIFNEKNKLFSFYILDTKHTIF